MPNLNFQTKVSGDKNGDFYIRGQKHEELIKNYSFSGALFLGLTGKVPSEAQVKMLDAILVACIDHGLAPASGFVPRVVAASGNEMTHALAAGVLTVGPYHGGAIELAGLLFERIKTEQLNIQTLVSQYRQDKKVFFGFGHRVYKENDPRTQALFAKADELGIANGYRQIATKLETEIATVVGKKLVLNVDGAVAVLILDLGLPIRAGNGIFALARLGGMIPHVLEEYELNAPVRRLEEEQIQYEAVS